MGKGPAMMRALWLTLATVSALCGVLAGVWFVLFEWDIQTGFLCVVAGAIVAATLEPA
jgi:hypothetical protein